LRAVFQERNLRERSLHVRIRDGQGQQADGTQCEVFKTRISSCVFERFDLHPEHVDGLITIETSG
jgi:hypothetical protein